MHASDAACAIRRSDEGSVAQAFERFGQLEGKSVRESERFARHHVSMTSICRAASSETTTRYVIRERAAWR